MCVQIHIEVYGYIYICMYIPFESLNGEQPTIISNIRICIHIHTYKYIHICVQIRIEVHRYICIHEDIYI
jgi:hypothetical protein